MNGEDVIVENIIKECDLHLNQRQVIDDGERSSFLYRFVGRCIVAVLIILQFGGINLFYNFYSFIIIIIIIIIIKITET